jgi:hypothetical protein
MIKKTPLTSKFIYMLFTWLQPHCCDDVLICMKKIDIWCHSNVMLQLKHQQKEHDHVMGLAHIETM